LHLFRFYRADPRYRKIIETELRPLWRAVEVDVWAKLPTYGLPHRPRVTSFDRLVAAVEGQPDPYLERITRNQPQPGGIILIREELTPPLLEQVADYVNAVHGRLRSRLGLTMNGLPAPWAADFVHNDVGDENALVRPNPVVAPNDQALEGIFIHQMVSPTSVFLDLVEEDESVIELPTRDEKYSFFGDWPGPGLSADDWDTLESKAHELLSHGLKALRERYEARADRYNPSKLKGESFTLQQLYLYLFPRYAGKRRPIPRDAQERLRKLAKAIEVDFPVASSRH
jgi:hypothetical protein